MKTIHQANACEDEQGSHDRRAQNGARHVSVHHRVTDVGA